MPLAFTGRFCVCNQPDAIFMQIGGEMQVCAVLLQHNYAGIKSDRASGMTRPSNSNTPLCLLAFAVM